MLIDIPNPYKERIVIIGGGFGGIQLARKLKNKPVQVVLIDKNNYHTFQPLLYQVATSAMEPDSIAYPIRRIFQRSKNIFFRVGEVTNIDAEAKKVFFGDDELEYTQLVVATGAVTNFLGNEGLTISSMPMKSVTEALDLRSMVLQNFEKCLCNSNERKRQGMMNIVIAGAGPTGVELAGALGEMKLKIFPKDYPELDLSQMNVYLVQSGDRVLPMLSEKSSARAARYLEKLGVTLVLNTRVLDFFGDYVQTTGEDLIARTLIWTAGVTGNPVQGIVVESVNKGNRIEVDEYCRVKGMENVYAIGDVASMTSQAWPKGHPQVAPVAMQMGALVARNVRARLEGKPEKPFVYKDKGSMATVGKNKAVVEIGKRKIGGSIAWFVWMAVHLMSLVGFKNKTLTFLNWTKNYLTGERSNRLILGNFDLYEEKRKRRKALEREQRMAQ
jgi:NADH dehydrogenase